MSTKPASKPGRQRTQTSKAKAQPAKKTSKQKKKKKPDVSSEDTADELEDEIDIPAKAVLDVDWKDPALSMQLVALIMESKDIKQSLYPPCGPNVSTTKGGGKPKTTAQWDLFVLLLGEDDKYKDAVTAAAIGKPKVRVSYGNKIKNRLSTMAKITRAFDTEMGETGAGIHRAADVNMNVTNSFTTKWAEISDSCPWFFDMRNLIAQRPNLVPTGLGHSSTGIVAGVIIPALAPADDDKIVVEGEEEDDDDDGTSSVPLGDWERSPGRTPELETYKRNFSDIDDAEDVEGRGSGDDYEPTSPVASETEEVDPGVAAGMVKAKGEETHRKNAAKPSTSKPAPAAPAAAPKPSKKTKMAEFSDIVKTEEKTRQKELELAALRMREQIKVTEVKGRLVEKREDRRREDQKARREERMMKLRMKELKMRNDHELRMSRAGTSTSHAANGFDYSRSSGSHAHSHSSGSHYTPSEPSDLPDLDNFDGNAVAGASSSTADVDFSDFRDFANYSYTGSS
ncbi:hypothetical protein B0H11DRAFT_1937702 [Mycena galericulata]|nr:hypothetical protein B0H11DRAFT_1937702 [Mycena galericulata]